MSANTRKDCYLICYVYEQCPLNDGMCPLVDLLVCDGACGESQHRINHSHDQ